MVLSWITGETGNNQIRNENICDWYRVESIAKDGSRFQPKEIYDRGKRRIRSSRLHLAIERAKAEEYENAYQQIKSPFHWANNHALRFGRYTM